MLPPLLYGTTSPPAQFQPMEGVEESEVPSVYNVSASEEPNVTADASAESSANMDRANSAQNPDEPRTAYVLDTNVLLSNSHSVKELVARVKRIMVRGSGWGGCRGALRCAVSLLRGFSFGATYPDFGFLSGGPKPNLEFT